MRPVVAVAGERRLERRQLLELALAPGLDDGCRDGRRGAPTSRRSGTRPARRRRGRTPRPAARPRCPPPCRTARRRAPSPAAPCRAPPAPRSRRRRSTRAPCRRGCGRRGRAARGRRWRRRARRRDRDRRRRARGRRRPSPRQRASTSAMRVRKRSALHHAAVEQHRGRPVGRDVAVAAEERRRGGA